MLQNTLRVGTLVHSSRSLQIKGSHEPISSHGRTHRNVLLTMTNIQHLVDVGRHQQGALQI